MRLSNPFSRGIISPPIAHGLRFYPCPFPESDTKGAARKTVNPGCNGTRR